MAKLQGNGSEIFDHNFKTEYKAGKPMKQSLAIAYGMKKKSQNKAMGGEMHGEGCECPKCHGGEMKAMGGEMGAMSEDDKDINQLPVDDEKSSEDSDDSLVMRIMKKRYSMGGEVANDTGEGQMADKMPNQFDDLVLDDSLENHDTGANSGDELGNSQEDEDRHDIISRIMKSRAKKDKNPRPA